MKKLMFAMAVAACALGAQADVFYYMATAYNNKEGFKNLSYYKAYTMDASTVAETIGGTASAQALAQYFTKAAWANNYDAVVADIVENASATAAGVAHPFNLSVVTNPEGHKTGDWIQATYAGTTSAGNQYIMFFYEKGDTKGYRVASLNAVETQDVGKTKAAWEDTPEGSSSIVVASTWTAWQTVEVPEPTSGLLMLLGMAGLALKRKRA